MQKILATTTALFLVAMMLPAGSAAETVTQEYTGTSGVRVLGLGIAVVWCPGSQSCDFDDDGQRDVGPIGGAAMESATGTYYTNIIVSTQDDFWGTETGNAACFYNPEGDNICDDDDYKSDFVCGTVALTGSTFAGDSATVWVHTLMITDDLDVCGGTSGTITANLF